MKKSIILLTALAASLLVFSCKAVVTPDNPDSRKPAETTTSEPGTPTPTPDPIPDPDPEEVFDPDFAHPGNVESISFTISDIPAEQPCVYILRKHNTDNKFEYYALYSFYTYTQSHTVTFEDKFVSTDKTYNYRYYTGYNPKNFVDITNGETKNFTPSTGLGELEYKEPLPEISYNPETTELSFSKTLEFNPDVDNVCTKTVESTDPGTGETTSTTYPVYYKAMVLSTPHSWLSRYVDYTKTSLNILQTFSHGEGDFEFKNLSPALAVDFIEDNTYKGNLWIFGKKYDINDKNMNIHFPVTLGVKNVENGIEVSFSRKFADDPYWNTNEIEIYEDGQKLDYTFYIHNNTLSQINNNPGKEKKFVFPFTTKGKEYTFKYKPSTNPEKTTIYEKTITAEYTSPLKIDDTKLETNFKNLQVNYTETDTASEAVRIVKVSPDATDIFSGRTESILKHVGIELHIYASTNNEDYYWQGCIKDTSAHTAKLLSSEGINLLDDGVVTTSWSINTNQAATFKFKVYIDFSVENEENQCGFFSFDEVESETFTWTPTASE